MAGPGGGRGSRTSYALCRDTVTPTTSGSPLGLVATACALPRVAREVPAEKPTPVTSTSITDPLTCPLTLPVTLRVVSVHLPEIVPPFSVTVLSTLNL